MFKEGNRGVFHMGAFDGLISGMVKGVLGQVDTAAVPSVLSHILAKTDLGNVGGLLAKLQEAGLGNQVSSWLGNGTNLPLSADQLRTALGNEQLQQVARSAGLPFDSLLGLLSQHLPAAVDTMSPDGSLQETGSLENQAGLNEIKT
jgi:uncharacterized protein YidB (DUF937 family)